MGRARATGNGSRPRTGFKLLKKERRCVCGKKVNTQIRRCPQCGKLVGFPVKGPKASG